jgi:hypothetical protein
MGTMVGWHGVSGHSGELCPLTLSPPHVDSGCRHLSRSSVLAAMLYGVRVLPWHIFFFLVWGVSLLAQAYLGLL